MASFSRLFFNRTSTLFFAARSTFAPAPRVVNSSFTFRTMASSAPGKKIEWLVVVPDFAGVGQKRLDIRP